MSTPFYDLASLVLVPSGYKAQKVYAQKPLTTDGQLTFSRASTATRVNSAGLIETVSSNVPRLDYLNSSCPRLLLEPQRLNLMLHSSAFDNAVWNKYNNAVTTANSTTAPDGTTTAETYGLSSASTTFPNIAQDFSAVNGQTYVFSVFAKKGVTNFVKLRVGGTAFASSTNSPIFNLNTGTVTSGTGSIQLISNGWYRCSFTEVAIASATGGFALDLPDANGVWNGSSVYTASDSVYIWGAQAEAGSYLTSLIPTTTAAVTRLADACSKTGVSSLIGQTEGTVFGEFTFTGRVPEMHMFLSVAGSYGNAIYVENSSSNRISMQVWSGVTQQCFIITNSYTVGQNIKFAAAYKNNDFVFYVNGTQIGTDTSGSVPSGLSQVEVGGYAEAGSPFNYSSPIKQAILFKTRLPNAQLAELTSL